MHGGQDIPNLKAGALRDALDIYNGSEELQSLIKSYNKSERIFEFHNGCVMEFKAVLRLVYIIATVVKPVFRVVPGYPVRGGLDDVFQRFAGAGLCGTQPRFEFAEGQFNGVEIGRVGRQV